MINSLPSVLLGAGQGALYRQILFPVIRLVMAVLVYRRISQRGWVLWRLSSRATISVVSGLLRSRCPSETEEGSRGFGGQPTNPETETVVGL